MFTEWDKAIVAAIMGILSLISLWTGWGIDFINEERIIALIAILTPIFVWLVPNKYASTTATTIR
jgi:hypothetical protein